MNNILAFRRPAAFAEHGTAPARPCKLLRFAPRRMAQWPRLIAEWRPSGPDGRLECHWQSESDDTGRKDISRRYRAGCPQTARHHLGQRLMNGVGVALSGGHAGRYAIEAP